MFMTDVNDVKIYNLSAGKSLPDVSVTLRCQFIFVLDMNFNFVSLFSG